MAGNTFGKLFQLHSFGESHGKAMGGIIEGFPVGFELDIDQIQFELLRRKTNQGVFSSPRKEADHLVLLSGIYDSKTLGTPIGFMIENKDPQSKDYDHLKDVYRPSHADYTWEKKFGLRDHRGGGRSSARETISRVVAGAMAKQYLQNQGIEIRAWVQQIGDVEWEGRDFPSLEAIENSPLRCPNNQAEILMQQSIQAAAQDGDTLGGVIYGQINGLPVGLGEPVFDKLHAVLGHAMLSINAVKGFEYGSGFEAAAMKGSEHNDEFIMQEDTIQTKTNWSGGIQGGISNGQSVYFRVAFKSVASISKMQNSINNQGESVDIEINGRHDVCVVPRAVPIVEAMAAMVIMDFCLLQKTNIDL